MLITNPEAKAFYTDFLRVRTINTDFYTLVPEDKFDHSDINGARKSSTPREFLAHQIDITRDYIEGVRSGELKYGEHQKKRGEGVSPSKDELLTEFKRTEQELKEILSDPDISDKRVKVPWSKELIPAVSSLYGLSEHEVLHTGRNMCTMEHLGMEKYPSLVNTWGK